MFTGYCSVHTVNVTERIATTQAMLPSQKFVPNKPHYRFSSWPRHPSDAKKLSQSACPGKMGTHGENHEKNQRSRLRLLRWFHSRGQSRLETFLDWWMQSIITSRTIFRDSLDLWLLTILHAHKVLLGFLLVLCRGTRRVRCRIDSREQNEVQLLIDWLFSPIDNVLLRSTQ